MSSLYFSNKDTDIIEFRNSIPEDITKFSEASLLWETSKSRSTATYESYISSIDRQLEDINLHGFFEISEYLKFAHDFDPSTKYENLNAIISFFSLHRLPDLYFYLLRVLRYCHLNNIEVKRTIKVTRELQNDIKVDELEILLNLFDDNFENTSHLESDINKTLQDYLLENYQCVIYNSSNLLKKNPSCSILYEVISKSKPLDSDIGKYPEIVKKIIIGLSDLHNQNNIERGLRTLNAIFLNLKKFDWAFSLKAKLTHFSYQGNSRASIMYKLAELCQVRISPFDISKLDLKRIGSQPLDSYYSGAPIVNDFLKSIVYDEITCPPKISKWRYLKSKADFLRNQCYYDEALQLYQKLLNINSTSTSKYDLNSKKIECLFYSGRKVESIIALASDLLEDAEPSIYPLETLSIYIKREVKTTKDVKLLEACVIVLHFYNMKYPDDNVTQFISNMLEVLLENLGIHSADDLNELSLPINSFVLTHVLTIDVMDGMILLFPDDTSIYLTKLNLCSKWLRNDSVIKNLELRNHITNEYNSTFNRMVLDICTNDMSDGRIKIEKEPLKALLIEKLGSSFESLNRDVDLDDLNYVNFKQTINSVSITGNGTVVVLADLISKLWKEYTVNKLYGLDNCLNLRFRHGEIVNHLWAPLDNYGIAGKKSTGNEFLLDRVFGDYALISDKALRLIKSNHAEMLKKIERLILNFRDNCRADSIDFVSNDGRFFIYPLNSGFLENFVQDFKDGKSLESLIEMTFSWLDDLTDNILNSIRARSIPKLKNDIEEAVQAVIEASDGGPHDYLGKLRLSKEELKSRVLSMGDWFDWSGEPSSPFTFGAVFEKAFSITRSIYPLLTIENQVQDTTSLLIKPNLFTSIVTAMTLAVENAARHNGSERKVTVKITINLKGSELTIDMANSITSESALKARDKIDHLNEDLSKNNLDKASKDTGSGIYKLKALFSDRIKLNTEIKTRLVDNNFNLKIITSDVARLKYEHSDS